MAIATRSIRLTILPAFVAILAVGFAHSADPESQHRVSSNRSPETYPPGWLEQISGTVAVKSVEVRSGPLQSAASCSASACHGGPLPGQRDDLVSHGSEYPLWLERDPHARSWDTMLGAASLAILAKLNIYRDGVVMDAKALSNCLACHNTSRDAIIFESSDDFEHQHREGVGCGCCHGQDERWRSEHFRARRDRHGQVSMGMAPLQDVIARARVCASCHIGDADRDMNHDIIAAGHPALHYEFATYHAMLPKHWRESNSITSAQLWAAGQVAAVDAFLALTESRAGKKLSVSTWPEFASSDCSDCHQNLRLPQDESRDVAMSVAGLGTWNRKGLEALLSNWQTQDGAAAKSLNAEIAKLVDLFGQAPIVVQNEGPQVVQQARIARASLERWLKDNCNHSVSNFSNSKMRDAVVYLASNNEATWESTTQLYLAAIAASDLPHNAAFQKAATRVREGLLFRPGFTGLALADDAEQQTATLDAVGQLVSRLQPGYDGSDLRGVIPLTKPEPLQLRGSE